jgi:RNA polymerase sigma-70 factor (ECF subfamily)
MMAERSFAMTSIASPTPSFKTLTDIGLIELALAGETGCFAILMERHLTAIRKQIRSMVRSSADSDDVAQDVVLKVWRRLGTFRGESSFRTWLTRVAVNEVLQAYRWQRRRPAFQEPVRLTTVASAAESPYQALVRVEEIQAVRNAVRQLPAIYRRVLVLREFEELSLQETAERLQASIPAVKTRLFRARRMLLVALKRSSGTPLAKAA